MTDPYAETHWCRSCGVHRSRSAAGLCPSCKDDSDIAERAARKPPP